MNCSKSGPRGMETLSSPWKMCVCLLAEMQPSSDESPLFTPPPTDPCKMENVVLRMKHQTPCQRPLAHRRALGSPEERADFSGPPSPPCIITYSCPIVLGTVLCHRPMALHPHLLLWAGSVISFSLCPSVHLTKPASILCHVLGWNCCRHRGE